MILALVDEAVAAGAREERAGEVIGIAARTLARWRAEDGGEDRRQGPGTPPPHKLCLLYTSPSPRDGLLSRMPSSA